MIEKIIFFTGLISLIFTSITDIKKREVPDFISYFLIFSGLLIYTVKSTILFSLSPIISCITGITLSYFFSAFLCYTGQWGGGDAKLLIGLTSILITTPAYYSNKLNIGNIEFLLLFIIGIFLFGSIYTLIYSIVLVILNPKKVYLSFKAKVISNKSITMIVSVTSILLILFSNLFNYSLKITLLTIGIMSIIFLFLFLLLKAIEESLFILNKKSDELVEGDWVIEDVFIENKDMNIQEYFLFQKDLDYISFFNKIKNLKKSDDQIKKIKETMEIKNLVTKLSNEFEVNENLVKKVIKVKSKSQLNELIKDKNKVKNIIKILKENGFEFNRIKVCGVDGTGLEKKHITLLQKHNVKSVRIKEGIPFVPAFLISFLMVYIININFEQFIELIKFF